MVESLETGCMPRRAGEIKRWREIKWSDKGRITQKVGSKKPPVALCAAGTGRGEPRNLISSDWEAED